MEIYLTFASESAETAPIKAVVTPISSNRIRMSDIQHIYEQAYAKNLTKIIGYAQSFLGSRAEAEDVVHEAFAGLWKNRDKVIWDPQQMTAWLYVTVRNSCINLLRKRCVRKGYNRMTISQKTDILNLISLESAPLSSLYTCDINALIEAGLKRMSPKVRRTFYLSRHVGLKNREIAAAEGISERAVEVRISSALLVMRRVLKDYLNEI